MKNRLEELRKARGIKQEALAQILEVSRQTIGSLENGRYNPSILLAFKIARLCRYRLFSIRHTVGVDRLLCGRSDRRTVLWPGRRSVRRGNGQSSSVACPSQ